MTTALAALLGAIQGVTEFLPISSKTHLVVVPALLGKESPSLAFITMLHLGTLVALLAYFARDLARIVADLPRKRSDGRRLTSLLVLATIPAVIIGLVFEETFESLLSHPREVALSLLATAVVLTGAEWMAGTFGRRPARPLRQTAGTRDAIVVGLAQAVAFLPGVSRSGVTMGAGLTLGLTREAAARFSFLLAIPAIAGANALELGEVIDAGIGAPEVAGFLTALITGYACVAVLLRYLRRWNYLPFAAYCAIFAPLAWLLLG